MRPPLLLLLLLPQQQPPPPLPPPHLSLCVRYGVTKKSAPPKKNAYSLSKNRLFLAHSLTPRLLLQQPHAPALLPPASGAATTSQEQARVGEVQGQQLKGLLVVETMRA